jgi:hypothetical protein
MNGKPMTEKVISDCIMQVLEVNRVPLTQKEIEKGIKMMKTIGKVIPETEGLVDEYRLIKQKKSRLSKSQRDSVEYKINFLLQRGVITEQQLS